MKAIILAIFFWVIFSLLPAFSFAAGVSVSPVSVSSQNPIIGDAFTLTATMSAAAVGSSYYLKCRAGANSSSLTDAQTYNSQSSQWLDDTGSTGAWTDMPQVTIGADGSWQGSLQCRIKNSATDETKQIFIRACLNSNNSCGTSFQSSSSLSVNPIYPTATPTPIPTATNTPTPTKTPTPSPTPLLTPTKTVSPTISISQVTPTESISNSSKDVLGSFSEDSPTPTNSQKSKVISVNSQNKFLIFMFVGLIFVALCVILILWQYREIIMERFFRNEIAD